MVTVGKKSEKSEGRLRTGLLVLAAVRAVVGIAAIPLAPVLYKDHFLWLVFMRPTKEVLLAGGFLARRGDVWIVPIIAAAIPLVILGVWQFYFLGRAYAEHIESGDVPKWARRILDPDRVKKMQKLLKRKGPKLILMGRLAAFPSSVLAMAAGSGDMEPRKFLRVDLAGALLSIAEVVGAGFLLGQAYESAGPWITVAGVAVLVACAIIVARALRKM